MSMMSPLKFIYSEKATKFCQISTLLLSVCTVDQCNVEIWQNFVAISEYMSFKELSFVIFGENLQMFFCTDRNSFFH